MSRKIFDEPDELPDALDWMEMATASIEAVLRTMWRAEEEVCEAVDEIQTALASDDGTTFDPDFLRDPVDAYVQALAHYDEQQKLLDTWVEELEAARAERTAARADGAPPSVAGVAIAGAEVDGEARVTPPSPVEAEVASTLDLIETIDGLIAQLEAAKRGLRDEDSERPG